MFEISLVFYRVEKVKPRTGFAIVGVETSSLRALPVAKL